jgi:hypothetical protein
MIKGQCLCGAVQYQYDGEIEKAFYVIASIVNKLKVVSQAGIVQLIKPNSNSYLDKIS